MVVLSLQLCRIPEPDLLGSTDELHWERGKSVVPNQNQSLGVHSKQTLGILLFSNSSLKSFSGQFQGQGGAWLQQGINERLVWFACWSKFSQSGQFSLSLKSVAIGLLQTQHTNCWFWSMHVQNSDTIWPKHQSHAPQKVEEPTS